MIVAKRKPLEEIKASVQDFTRVLTVGCGTCVAVCLAGGEKEVTSLNAELSMSRTIDKAPVELGAVTIERQCDREFLAELDHMVEGYEALVSMACGVGIQFLAERFPHIPVFPGVDTTFMGANQDVGWYEERCRGCGTCVLAYTAGICPVTTCSKGLFNGPCGGTSKGSCEVNPDTPCAWQLIYERLGLQNRVANIMPIFPAQEWRNQIPRTVVQPGYEHKVGVQER
ncbi:MAG: methylenetetrahydrofolate reductase C-terminal domain-containing protein [Desulfovermiculus sp.]|nr:methylenetetrahydrofolate reductase C-terminal domain-containing protein [Desulfovermiculus sp.]